MHQNYQIYMYKQRYRPKKSKSVKPEADMIRLENLTTDQNRLKYSNSHSGVEMFDLCFDLTRSITWMLFDPKSTVENTLLPNFFFGT